MENINIFFKLFLLIASISGSNGENNAEIQKIWKTLADQQNTIVQLKEQVKECSRSKRFLNEEQYGGSKVGFTAKLSKHMVHLGNNQAIVFDQIVTNIGHHYSPNTGVFTSPTNATYYFFASILSHTGEVIEAEIVKNGVRMVMMYSYDTAHEQGSNGAVLQLNVGDEVWVRHITTQGSKVYGNGWSTFVGFKIYAD